MLELKSFMKKIRQELLYILKLISMNFNMQLKFLNKHFKKFNFKNDIFLIIVI